MNGAALTQFLIDITRGDRKDAFAETPDVVLASSGLDENLRAAIRERNIGALWEAHAHPMALLYFARASGWSSERYYRCIEGTGRC